MKPNDEAYQAAADAISLDTVFDLSKKECFDIAKIALDAAYAAQFHPSEDYAGLVEELRSSAILGRRFVKEHNGWIDQYEKAADAIETLLAKLSSKPKPSEDYDALLKSLHANAAISQTESENQLDEHGVNSTLYIAAADALEAVLAERDALVSEIKTICDRESDTVDVGFELKAQNERLRTERDALLARLAPVEDEELQKNVSDELQKLWESRLAFGAEELNSHDYARAAIKAARPHIEAAERERSSEFLGLFLELLGALKKVVATHHQCINLTPETISKFEDLASQAEEIAAAIRSGK